MSYSIHVYPITLREETELKKPDFSGTMDFIEASENLVAFTPGQVQLIEKHLDRRGYHPVQESKDRKVYGHKKYQAVEVLFVPTGLFFMARGEDIMEISMTAGEFRYFPSLQGNFAVLDPQNEGWQD